MRQPLFVSSLRHLVAKAWQAVYGWFKANTTTPGWMPRRWRHPLVGYLVSAALTLLVIALEVIGVHTFPHVPEVAGIFVFLVILFLGLNWGAGPCLIATILGTFLLYYLIYPPLFGITRKDFIDIVQDGLVLFGGLLLTQAMSQRERQRREAEQRASKEEAARQQAEALADSLANEQAKSEQERQRLSRVIAALLAMVEALVQAPDEDASLAEESIPTVDVAARQLAALAFQIQECQSLSLSRIEPETGALTILAVAGAFPVEALQEQIRWHQQLQQKIWLDATLAAHLRAGEMIEVDQAQPSIQYDAPLAEKCRLRVKPMQIGPRLVGLLMLEYEREGEAPTTDDRALTAAVARLGALVIERERLIRTRTEAQANVLALSEANRQMELFLSLASHELKTPLTSIILGLQMSQQRSQRLAHHIAEGTGDVHALISSLQTTIEAALHQGSRLNGLVNDLLETSSIQAGVLPLQIKPADLIAIVRAAVEEQRWLLPERTIHLHLPQRASLPITADAGRIEQVVTNFLSNALRYSAEDRPVEVGVQIEPQQARIWVRDQGPGLPPEAQAHIWERFYRAPGVEVQSGSGIGLGIGLYISRTIVEQHQGQVGLQSAPGEGSTFWFTLPLRSPE
jgi:signal transduction histidine kinase